MKTFQEKPNEARVDEVLHDIAENVFGVLSVEKKLDESSDHGDDDLALAFFFLNARSFITKQLLSHQISVAA